MPQRDRRLVLTGWIHTDHIHGVHVDRLAVVGSLPGALEVHEAMPARRRSVALCDAPGGRDPGASRLLDDLAGLPHRIDLRPDVLYVGSEVVEHVRADTLALDEQ